jgi:hypothetical protein
MNAADVMAIVLFLFFLVGVAVGVLVVFAMSARRAHKAGPPLPPVAPRPSAWPSRLGHDPDDREPNEPSWWHVRDDD